ncbi:benzylsuccinate CoA-transferase BbsE subunit [Humitalea rosea]|uniref:Benzylsuccinate CoA-transferase BbsE subunit n=1 Tax=Humitalea rosea TaxID=990373 RepID=A0A2W7J9M6_9PROT|nr:CoA transferase [Humitalea rosea]PZW48049.1 benzylsuccinate CoA-transferase BbsE subunit [Humitalea rosea]
MSQPADRPYDALRIIDLTRELSAYATRLFADLGAEVIRVEPISGRADRGEAALPGLGGDVSYAFLNANKKSIALDLESEAGRAVLVDLIASAGAVVIDGEEAALLPLVLSVPGARVVTLISHFGLDGPYAGYLGSDLVTQSLGGITWMSGDPGSPPLRIAGGQAGFVASLYAATATALALYDIEVNGGGAHLIDVSAQECIAHSLQNALQVWDLEGRIPMRGGEGTRDATEQIFACQDGHVFLASPLSMPLSWKALVDWMAEEGHPGGQRLAELDWSDRRKRATRALRDEFRALFESFAANKSKAEMRNQALRRRIIMAPVSGIADLAADPQLVFRRYFHDLPHPAAGRALRFPGAPYRLSEPVWRVDRPAPLVGEQSEELLGRGALHSIAG